MYGYGYPYGFYVDPTYVLLIIGMVLALAASGKMKSTFARYQQVRSHSGLTGAQTAQRILNAAGIYDVTIVPISGSLTDHYDPRTKRLALSQDVYGRTSVAAVCVAAHECGHSAQYKLCTAEYPFSYCSGGKYRIFPFLADFSSGTDPFHTGTYNCRNCAVFTGGTVSACNTSGRIQCFLKSFKNAGKHRNFKPRGKQRCEEGSYSGSPYLCSSSCFFHFTASETDHTFRR